MRTFIEDLRRAPVIAAARHMQGVEAASQSAARAIFLLGGSILTLGAMADLAHSKGKRVFVHLDLLEGLGRDTTAVEWCIKTARPDGLISTRAPLLRAASDRGLITIQRLFAMDSSAIGHGIKQLAASRPNMVEVLPGVIPKLIAQLRDALPHSEIIAGGMITGVDEVHSALRAGALGVSSSDARLWEYTPGSAERL